MIPFARSSSRISSALAKFFAFLASWRSAIRSSISLSRISSFFTATSPSTSQSFTRISRIPSAKAALLSSVTFVLANLTSSNTAASASAVLKSSSIASSNFFTYPSASARSFFSASVSSTADAFSLRSFRRPAASVILSRAFLEDSIRSALKFSGLL